MGGEAIDCEQSSRTSTALDPLDTLSGNFSHHVVDFDLPTRGLPLSFARTYNARDAYTGPLGRGWTHSFNTQLYTTTEHVVWQGAQGARMEFTDNGDGTFTPDAGIRATLFFTQDTYTLIRGDNLVYTFNVTGTLTGLADNLGRTTTLTYTDGDLTTIRGADGRALTLSYNDQGRITQITDPLWRTALYTYTDNVLTLSLIHI